MPARWQLFDIAHAPIVAEIERQSDRAAAIVATAFLEEQLVETIKASLANEPKIIKNIFKGQGPLASLSAKIDLGLLLGLYDKRAHRELHTIKDIRNRFAHRINIMTFDTDGVAGLCNNLPAPKRKRPPRITEKRDEHLSATDTKAWMYMWLDWIHSGKDTPRNRFLIAVRIHYFRFSLWRMIKERTGETPPTTLADESPQRASP
jgi:DNA-binding MltR family transcriptional regulator